MRQREKEETALFYIGWCLVLMAVIFLLIYQLFPIPFSKLMRPCMVNSLLGIYCPGCGGTRAVSALLRGNLAASFLLHPLVPYAAIAGGWFLISQSIERVFRHHIRIGMKYRDGYVWAALIIVAVNFIVKNLLLTVWHIDLIQMASL